VSLNEDEQLHKCRDLLNWFVNHRYLQGVSNDRGQRYKRLACLIEDSLNKLPDDYQQLLYYCYVEGTTTQELLPILGTSETMFYVHKRTAVLMLADVLGDEVLKTWRKEMLAC